LESKIDLYEKESQYFKPLKHFISRIQEMEGKSSYGADVSVKWKEIVNQSLINEVYPVVHPIGQETFSLYMEFPTGVFECALDIDSATSLIAKKGIRSVTFRPTNIINSVDEGNINKDTSRIKTNHKNPVMVLQSQYLTDNKPFCINGNHRIFEAYRNNKEQIEVFVFKELEFVPFFYDVLSKATYFLEIDYYNVINNKRSFLKGENDSFAFEI
jgi:hypothetical protein